jgi:hypothetical protein
LQWQAFMNMMKNLLRSMVASWVPSFSYSQMTLYQFLAYFPKMKVGLSNYQSVCVSPTNDFWTTW